MSVPSTITSIRQQIVEGAKLALASECTFLSIWSDWGANKTESAYPLGKCYMGASSLVTEYIGRIDVREDDLVIVVAPWCVASTFELETSKVIESFAPLLNTEVVRAQMNSAYQPALAKITLNTIEVMETDLVNPCASVKLSYKVRYKIST